MSAPSAVWLASEIPPGISDYCEIGQPARALKALITGRMLVASASLPVKTIRSQWESIGELDGEAVEWCGPAAGCWSLC
jgi:hypothetical protein